MVFGILQCHTHTHTVWFKKRVLGRGETMDGRKEGWMFTVRRMD